MPYVATAPEEPITDFGKGIDLDAPRTAIPMGSYEDAENMLLYGDESGQHLASMKVDVELDEDATWPDGSVVWFAPFTYTSYDSTSGVLTSLTHLLLHKSDGAFYRYDAGAPGSFTLVRRFDTAAQLTTHFVYDQWLVVMNGRDAPMKYGQHFLWDGQGETRPFLFPLGSKPISPLGPSITGETWNTGASQGSFVNDSNAPGTGARVGTQCLKVLANKTMTVNFTAARNFTQGPRPYTGSDFTTSDYLQFQYAKDATAGNLVIRFGDSTMTNYFQFTHSSFTADSDWHSTGTTHIRSSVATTGAPNWNSISRIDFINQDPDNPVFLDDLYFLYAIAPPAALVGAAHKDRVVLGGVSAAGSAGDPAFSTLFYSTAAKPDEFPSDNTQIVSGGSASLARTNRIMVIREYGDSLIVGTQNAIFAWTVGTDGAPSRSTITTETGMDSPRACVETPSGSLLFPWQSSLYILRQTGREYASAKIAPLLRNIWAVEPWWTMGIKDEKTKTIRFWWREKLPDDAEDPSECNRGIVYDYVRSRVVGDAVWPSQMTQMADYAVEAYVNGVRETLYSHGADNHIHRMHVDEGGRSVVGDTDTLTYSVTFPWKSLENKDNAVKWIAMVVPYKSETDVKVQVRYAQNPSQFATALWQEVDPLPSTTTEGDKDEHYGRVHLGGASRWAQVRLRSEGYGFEIYPPVVMKAMPTVRE